MKRSAAWADLHKHSQQNLSNFLNIEVDITITLCEMAQKNIDAARRENLRGQVDKALGTVRRFAGRIEDTTTQNSILDRVGDPFRVTISSAFFALAARGLVGKAAYGLAPSPSSKPNIPELRSPGASFPHRSKCTLP